MNFPVCQGIPTRNIAKIVQRLIQCLDENAKIVLQREIKNVKKKSNKINI